MPITVECQSCGAVLKAPDAAIGKSLPCPKCKTSVFVDPEAESSLLVQESVSSHRQSHSGGARQCPYCSEEIAASAIKCKHCGSALGPGYQPSHGPGQVKLIYPSSPPKEPVLMALLSGLCIVGLGQMILGQVTKGVVFLIGAMVVGAATLGTGVVVIWPLAGIDAYMVARKLQRGEPVTEWECFPS